MSDLNAWITQVGAEQLRTQGSARWSADEFAQRAITFTLDDGYLVAREFTGVEVSPMLRDRFPLARQMANAAELLARAVAERIIILDATYGWLVGETGYRSGSDVDGGVDGLLRHVAAKRAA